MGLEIQTGNRATPQDVWVADRRLWLTADQQSAVEDGDPKAAFLLCAPGQAISRARAESLGLIPQPAAQEKAAASEGKKAHQPEDKEAEKVEDKQVAKPADKSKTSKRKRSTKRRKK